MGFGYGEECMMKRVVLYFIILSTNPPQVWARFTPYAKAVVIDTLPYLDFERYKLTNYRRNEPLYQLKCISGCEYEIDWVKCFNVKSPFDRGPAWRCQADLPSHLQFSTIEVICEGYESMEDKNILEGSCGLEYSLKEIDQPKLPSKERALSRKQTIEDRTTGKYSNWGACHWLLLSMVINVCCYCLYQVVQSDLKEVPSSTHLKTSRYLKCEKCVCTCSPIGDYNREKHEADLHGWPQKSYEKNESCTSPRFGALASTCNNRMREPDEIATASPRYARGGLFKKLERPSRSRNISTQDDFDIPPSR